MTTWFGYGIKDSIVVDNDDYDDDDDHGDRERAQIASLRLHVTHMPTAHATNTCDRTKQQGGPEKRDRGLLGGG